MNKWSELLTGVLLIIIPIVVAFYSQNWGAWNFWSAAGTFFKGGLFWFVVMIGVLFVLLGISDLKENTPAPMPAKPSAPAVAPKRKK
jgi:RsiW-degrading membrane proteinase PrsW (M82 family)